MARSPVLKNRSKGFVPTRQWWKSATVYQIYPISFFDSNGDGIGDLNGIIAKLDYLKGLGVDVIWLSPIYKSPLADMGYDISDYNSIDERYGTLEDWDKLLHETHARGMKLIMDLVVNHTSDEHEWFIESKLNKTNPKRDWYIWRPPRYDEHGNRMPPNNWKSVFQGPAWEYDETTGEYYLHLFVTKQPDLNWENPDVREAVWKLMRFWLDRGCDGFRMDVINHISKVEGLPDAEVIIPTLPYQPGNAFYINGPKVHDYIREMNERVLSHYPHIMTVGEAPITHNPPDIAKYVYPQNKELDMVFQFEFIDIDAQGGKEAESPILWKPWRLQDMKDVMSKWQSFGREDGFWNSIFIENHDNSRSVSRFGDDSPEWRGISAKLLCIFQTTLTGTLYVYQGQEIGMKNAPKEWGLEEYKDPATINFWNQTLEKRVRMSGKREEDIDMSDIMEGCQRKARDHGRTPVQWDSSPHSGFTTGTPWMRVNDDDWNVASQIGDPDSVFSFWKRALEVRKNNECLVYGDFKLLFPTHPTIFAYTRTLEGGSSALVVMNFSSAPVAVTEEVKRMKGARLLLSNYPVKEAGDQAWAVPTVLRGYEGRVYLRGECCGAELCGCTGVASKIPEW
ncbi:alpha amylase [Cristinia sonorae]|uniref:Alpha amylase n=1 Tax=Cristinia sonorae TaxID=1940300 RepID=A0A8K0UFR8_9AGAR|nr:alpha amylase [Cristinia sonorae]